MFVTPKDPAMKSTVGSSGAGPNSVKSSARFALLKNRSGTGMPKA